MALGAGPNFVLPEVPSNAKIALWSIGVALALFTLAQLVWYATLSHPQRLEETLILFGLYLCAEVGFTRQAGPDQD